MSPEESKGWARPTPEHCWWPHDRVVGPGYALYSALFVPHSAELIACGVPLLSLAQDLLWSGMFRFMVQIIGSGRVPA